MNKLSLFGHEDDVEVGLLEVLVALLIAVIHQAFALLNS